jgi:hypothetical protein
MMRKSDDESKEDDRLMKNVRVMQDTLGTPKQLLISESHGNWAQNLYLMRYSRCCSAEDLRYILNPAARGDFDSVS